MVAAVVFSPSSRTIVHCGFFLFKQKTAYEMLRSLVGSEMCIRDSSMLAVGDVPRNGIGIAVHCRDFNRVVGLVPGLHLSLIHI